MNSGDDVILEAEDGEGSTGTPEQKLKMLRDKLRSTEAEAAENLAGWQRSKADYVNLQKRARDDVLLLSETTKVRIIESLVPVFDSIEASAHETVFKQLESTLEKHGITRYRPETGTEFDPNTAEAVSTVATNNKLQDNKIDSVLQSGYRSGDSIIRPARVTVQHYE